MNDGLAVTPSLLQPAHGPWPPQREQPSYFRDFLLDELESVLFGSQAGFGLERVFRSPLADTSAVEHRQSVARDLEREPLAQSFRTLFQRMDAMRARLDRSRRASHPWQRRLFHLQGADAYLRAVEELAADLAKHPPESVGLRRYGEYLEAYTRGPAFSQLRQDWQKAHAALVGLRYTLRVHEGRLALRAYEGEPDFGRLVVETFRPFFGPEPPAWKDPTPSHGPWLNHVEEWVLDHLALLFPEAFRLVEAFCDAHAEIADPALVQLEAEARFFLTYLEFVAPMRSAGLRFVYPEVAEEPPCFAEEAFDLVLGAKLLGEGGLPVGNGFRFDSARVLVVTGPNQGGKTTYALMLGQLPHLAALGLPVPGSAARLLLPDAILSHFEARENPEELKSKLEEDLLRLRDVLERATDRSLVVLNEPFASATLLDARLIGGFVLDEIRLKRALAVVVTFLDEFARLPGVRSMVAEVDPSDPARRTFRVRERPADGKAYALALAKKHGLTYDALLRRLGGGG